MILPTSPSFSLSGKKALVAGASSGIGAACAVALARAGADVLLAARRKTELNEIVGALAAEGLQASALVMDVGDVENTRELVNTHGPFDVLVNSAGLARHGVAIDTKPADFDAVMNINVRGAYFLTQAVAKGLLAHNKPGSLINISSQMALLAVKKEPYIALPNMRLKVLLKQWLLNGANKAFVLTLFVQPSY